MGFWRYKGLLAPEKSSRGGQGRQNGSLPGPRLWAPKPSLAFLFLLCLQNRYHMASILGYPLLLYLVMLLQWEVDTECESISLPGFSRSLLLNKGMRHTVGGVLESGLFTSSPITRAAQLTRQTRSWTMSPFVCKEGKKESSNSSLKFRLDSSVKQN